MPDKLVSYVSFLAEKVALARAVTLSTAYMGEVMPEAIYLFGVFTDEEIASNLIQFIEFPGLKLMTEVHDEGVYEKEIVKLMSTVANEDGQPGVYLGSGFPAAIDGPNQLSPDLQLVYVGSGTSMSKRDRNDAWETGMARRVWLYGHLVRAIT